jgi:hypothetical protein
MKPMSLSKHILMGAAITVMALASVLIAAQETEQAEQSPSAKLPAKSPSTGRRTTPVVLFLLTYQPCDALIDALNAGLCKPFDQVICMPGDVLQDSSKIERLLGRVKVGTHAWLSPSFALAQQAAAADRIPKTAKWLSYDYEEYWKHTPEEEKADVVGTSRALRAFCNQRGLKAAITPISKKFNFGGRFNLEFVKQLAVYYDAYIIQCQDFQRDPTPLKRKVELLRQMGDAIHSVNPKCLFGVQLGSADHFGDGTPGGGVKAAMALYEGTKGFVQIYSVWWQPDQQRMIELLKAMDASPAPKSPPKAESGK